MEKIKIKKEYTYDPSSEETWGQVKKECIAQDD